MSLDLSDGVCAGSGGNVVVVMSCGHAVRRPDVVDGPTLKALANEIDWPHFIGCRRRSLKLATSTTLIPRHGAAFLNLSADGFGAPDGDGFIHLLGFRHAVFLSFWLQPLDKRAQGLVGRARLMLDLPGSTLGIGAPDIVLMENIVVGAGESLRLRVYPTEQLDLGGPAEVALNATYFFDEPLS